jgi:ABC-2 type transport system ATP-binding protein
MIHRGRKVLDGTLTTIQSRYRQDTIRVRTDEGMAVLTDLPGVERVTDFGQDQELRVMPDCDAQKVLTKLLTRAKVQSFEIVKPSLHDIFIRIAGDEAGGQMDV